MATRRDLLKGGSGKNTIAGGDGADAIVGGDQNDSLVGNDGADLITPEAGLKDTVSGGVGDDTVDMSTNLDNLDSVDGGAHSSGDTLLFTDSNSDSNDLALVTGFETITLGAAVTDIATV